MESLLRVVGISARGVFAAFVSLAVWVAGVGVMTDSVRWLAATLLSIFPGRPAPRTSALTESVRPSEQLTAFGERIEWTWLASQSRAATKWVDVVQPRWDRDELLLIPIVGVIFTAIAIAAFFASESVGVPFTGVASGWASVLIAGSAYLRWGCERLALTA